MNCAFKGFFDTSEAAEAAYYILRNKNLVIDIETSNLSTVSSSPFSAKIAYGLEGNTMLASSGISDNVSAATLLTNNDPRVAMTPILFNKKQTPEKDACFLYGHCRKKDIPAVTSCLKRNGAFSVLSSDLNRKSRLIH